MTETFMQINRYGKMCSKFWFFRNTVILQVLHGAKFHQGSLKIQLLNNGEGGGVKPIRVMKSDKTIPLRAPVIFLI